VAGTVAIEATATAGDVVLAVRDEGPGIPPPERERIFERGVRVGSRPRDGIGFGLFIAQGLVHAHQGRIWVDPSSSAGTRIVVSLPRADLEAR
jgi:signal transduction histidine kinase